MWNSLSKKSVHAAWIVLSAGVLGVIGAGCQSTPINLANGPAPLRMPWKSGEGTTYEDSLTGGEVFSMYCNQCHNARALGERNLANYSNVAAHMRVRANLTGKEYEKLLEFLRRWHDSPGPTPPVEPSPKRLIYGQPIAELRDEIAPTDAPAAPPAAASPPAGPAQPAVAPAPAALAPAPAAVAPAPPALAPAPPQPVPGGPQAAPGR